MNLSPRELLDHHSLPPLVHGKLQGFLHLEVEGRLSARYLPGQVCVEAKWWGEDTFATLRAGTIEAGSNQPFSFVYKYDLRAPEKQLQEYLNDCKGIILNLIDVKRSSVISTVDVKNVFEVVNQTGEIKSYPLHDTHDCCIGYMKINCKIRFQDCCPENSGENLQLLSGIISEGKALQTALAQSLMDPIPGCSQSIVEPVVAPGGIDASSKWNAEMEDEYFDEKESDVIEISILKLVLNKASEPKRWKGYKQHISFFMADANFTIQYRLPSDIVQESRLISHSSHERIGGEILFINATSGFSLPAHRSCLDDEFRRIVLEFFIYYSKNEADPGTLIGSAYFQISDLFETALLSQTQLIPVIESEGNNENFCIQLKIELGVNRLSFTDDAEYVLDVMKSPAKSDAENVLDVMKGPAKSAELGQLVTCAAPNIPNEDEKGELVYRMLHISDGNGFNLPNLFLNCREFASSVGTQSDLCIDKDVQHFHMHQETPIILNEKFVTKCCNNLLVIEVWQRDSGAPRDVWIGIGQLPIHAFFTAYRNKGFINRLLKEDLPVIAVDGIVQISNPVSRRAVGTLHAVLCMGTKEQIRTFKNLRGMTDGTSVHCVKYSAQSPSFRSSIPTFEIQTPITLADRKELTSKAGVETATSETAQSRGEKSGIDTIPVAMQTELQMVDEDLKYKKSVMETRDKTLGASVEESLPHFQASVDIESALVVIQNDTPDLDEKQDCNLYVVCTDTHPKIVTEIASGLSPAWGFHKAVELCRKLLTNADQYLTFKLLKALNPTHPDSSRDLHLGNAFVCVAALASGIPFITESAVILDFNYRNIGTIKVMITPLECVKTSISSSLDDVDKGSKPCAMTTATTSNPTVQYNDVIAASVVEVPDSFLGADATCFTKALKGKLSELDIITKRLKQRLDEVTDVPDESPDSTSNDGVLPQPSYGESSSDNHNSQPSSPRSGPSNLNGVGDSDLKIANANDSQMKKMCTSFGDVPSLMDEPIDEDDDDVANDFDALTNFLMTTDIYLDTNLLQNLLAPKSSTSIIENANTVESNVIEDGDADLSNGTGNVNVDGAETTDVKPGEKSTDEESCLLIEDGDADLSNGTGNVNVDGAETTDVKPGEKSTDEESCPKEGDVAMLVDFVDVPKIDNENVWKSLPPTDPAILSSFASSSAVDNLAQVLEQSSLIPRDAPEGENSVLVGGNEEVSQIAQDNEGGGGNLLVGAAENIGVTLPVVLDKDEVNRIAKMFGSMKNDEGN